MRSGVTGLFQLIVALVATVVLAGIAPAIAQGGGGGNPANPSDFSLSPGAFGSGQSTPTDPESQLKEIENTKRLMKALGELHAKPVPSSPGASQNPLPAVQVQDAQRSPAQASSGANEASSRLDLIGIPVSGLREAAGTAAQVARSLSGESTAAARPAARDGGGGMMGTIPDDGSAGARPRQRGADDEYRAQTLVDEFLEEVKPWAIGFAVIFAICYAIFSWASARASRGPGTGHAQSSTRSGSSSRSGSRRRRSSR